MRAAAAAIVVVAAAGCGPTAEVIAIDADIELTGVTDQNGDGVVDVFDAPLGALHFSDCDRLETSPQELVFCDCSNEGRDGDGALLPLVVVSYSGTGAFSVSEGDESILSDGRAFVIPIAEGGAEVHAAYKDGALYTVGADGRAAAVDVDAVANADGPVHVVADYDLDNGVHVHESHTAAVRDSATLPVNYNDGGSLACNAGCTQAGAAPPALVALAALARRRQRRRASAP